MATAAEIIEYWTETVGEAGWYEVDEAVDQYIRDTFGDLWERGATDMASPFDASPKGYLAALILFDQFPRNMFRDVDTAFLTDPLALTVAREAIAADADMAIDLPQRQFFYMPFMHSEKLSEQDEGIALIEARLKMDATLLHARAHREVISRFGRFPFRNAALGRDTTADEQSFLDAGGYGEIVRQLEGA